MKNFIYFLVAMITLLAISCETTNNTQTPEPRKLTQDEQLLVAADNNFGLKLFKEVNSEEGDKDKNIVVSPLSISMALGMTVNGAAGATRDSMLKTLELLGLTMDEVNQSYRTLIDLLRNLDKKVLFELANSIWYRDTYQFEQSFFDVCKNYFDAEVTGLNFDDPKSIGIINNWVNEKTKGKIKDIIDEIDPLSVMFLINAIYFKGLWLYQFDPKSTKDGTFFAYNGIKQNCKMMNMTARLGYCSNEEFQSVDLPYGNGKYSMTIFLPKVNINDFIGGLTQDKYSQWLSEFKKDSVVLSMPKFSNEYEITLNDALKKLGMSIAFIGGVADFSNMIKFHDLYISEVKHKTFILVDEEGTEAAAVTSVEIWEVSMPLPKIMRIDHPFVFVIRENHSQTILFIGKIVEMQ